MLADGTSIGAWGGSPDEINYDAGFWAFNSQDNTWVDFTSTWFPASQIVLADGDVAPLPDDSDPADNPGTSDVSVLFAVLAVAALGGTVILRKKAR